MLFFFWKLKVLYLFPEKIAQFFFDILNQLTNRSPEPNSYLEFSKQGVKFLEISTNEGSYSWPPSKGYSFNFWIKIDQISQKSSPSSSGNISTLTQDTHLFSIGVAKEFRMDCFISQKRILTLKTSEKDIAQFSQYPLKSGKWLFVTLSHGIKKPSKIGIMKLYTNGVWRQTESLGFPKTTSGKKLTGRFSSLNAPPNDTWYLGNAFLFSDIPTDQELFFLYNLGPNYVGLLNVSLPDRINPALLKKKSIRNFKVFLFFLFIVLLSTVLLSSTIALSSILIVVLQTRQGNLPHLKELMGKHHDSLSYLQDRLVFVLSQSNSSFSN